MWQDLVLLNGKELQNMNPHVTAEELRDHFAPRWRMVHDQRFRARLHKENKQLSATERNSKCRVK